MAKDMGTVEYMFSSCRWKVFTQQSFFGTVRNVQTCPDCHGTGKVIKDKCPDCRGTGYIAKKVCAIEVKTTEAPGPACTIESSMTILVILPSLLRVTQDRISFGGLFKFLLSLHIAGIQARSTN